MYKSILPLALLVVFSAAAAYDSPVEIVEEFDGVRIAASLSQEDADRNLAWTPFGMPPPLSVDEALRAVARHIEKGHAFADTRLTSVELKQLPHSSDWHYLVRVRLADNDNSEPHFFVVLMDGHVIPAIRVPESIK